MESPTVWINRPGPEGSSEAPPLTVGENCLHVGGVNLTDLYYEGLSNSNTLLVGPIVINYLTGGNFEVFCVRGISYEVLNFVREMMEGFDSNWKISSYEDADDELRIFHVVFFNRTILTFVDMAVSKIEHDSFFNYAVEENDLLSMESKKPKDCCGFVVVLKLVQRENSYVKILSVALPPLTCEEPVQNEKEKLFRNVYLKKALYTLFRVAKAPADSKCCYFVCGSLKITEGVDLLRSPVDEIITAGQLTMILPEDENGDYDNPNATTVVIEKLQYFDPELVVPLNTQGMISFLYHSKNAVSHAMCKKRKTSNYSETFYGNPCGGKFLLLDHEDTKWGPSILNCSLV